MVKKYIRENFDVKIHQNLLIEVYMHSVTECIMKDLNIGNISPIAVFRTPQQPKPIRNIQV